MSFKLYDQDISLEFNKTSYGICCSAKHGGTSILCLVNIGEWDGFGAFLPLSVSYFERSYAINKIPGGFVKREGRQRENETLISRVVDRAIRPTIDLSFRYRINITLIVTSYTKNCPVEALAITAASAGLYAAGVPCTPLVGFCMGYLGGKWGGALQQAEHQVCIAGNNYGLTTVESSGIPLSANTIMEGINQNAVPTIFALTDFVKSKLSKVKRQSFTPVATETHPVNIDGKSLVEAYLRGDMTTISKSESEFLTKWTDKQLGKFRWSQLVRSILRSNMLWTSKRCDNRGLDDIRHITISSDLMPAHGTCLFSRGKTQVLCVVTVSNGNESQIFESLDTENRKFVVHYNFLMDERYSGSPSRRDLGHGNLARNALRFAIGQDKFIRVVSEVIDADGSSSMATVCGAYLALRNAGIEVGPAIGGISIGVILDGFVTKFLTDLTQLEDIISDMDFKVAGTNKGFTAMQLDIKIPFMPWSSFETGLHYSFTQLQKVLQTITAPNKISTSNTQKHENPEQVTTEPEQPKSAQVKPDFKPKPKQSSDSKTIALPLTVAQLTRITESNIATDIKNEFQAFLNIKNDNVYIHGKNLPNAITKLLTYAFDSNKELWYGKVIKTGEAGIEIELLTGKKILIKEEESVNSLTTNSNVLVYKGKFGKWTFHSKL